MQQPQSDHAECADVPDRTPPSHARYRTRVRKTCVMCNGPYLVATPCYRNYQTCSPECSIALRSRSQQARFGRTPRADGTGTKPSRNASALCAAPPDPHSRPDIVPVGRAAADVLCVRCGGLRGRWRCSELPPPELCWRCVMRRNAGLESGIPLG